MILFLTPPLTQLNTPYPATTALMGWMRELGVEATQRDLSIEVALEVLRRYGPAPLTDEVIAFLQGKAPDEAETLAEPGYLPEGDSFRELEHIGWIEDPAERAKLRCSLFLDDLAAAIRDEIDPDFGFSRYAERLGAAVPDFGTVLRRLRRRSPVDRILEEKTEAALREVFGFKSGESFSTASLCTRLFQSRPAGMHSPIVSVTCPFPGTLLGAFRIAKTVRRLMPEAMLVLGGGYVNTELRFMNDNRVKRFFDVVMFDEGYAPWRDLLKEYLGTAPQKSKNRTIEESKNLTYEYLGTVPKESKNRIIEESKNLTYEYLGTVPKESKNRTIEESKNLTYEYLGTVPKESKNRIIEESKNLTYKQLWPIPDKSEVWEMPVPAFVRPSYAGLDLSQYIDLAETANPMHRLWSDGRWLKMQLARGCYWHKCAFCDVTLDYIKCFEMPDAATLVDAMQTLAAEQKGTVPICGGTVPMIPRGIPRGTVPLFHFTDEAIPPVLAEKLAKELIRRKVVCKWWGNVRFDTSWTVERCRLLARAGCIAVTGGLECANDRLLKMMNKGITLESARVALGNFAAAGIMVHAYLMYGFPTETVRELEGALRYVRDRFREGVIQSAFFHRFALTIHSPIAREPEKFGIRVKGGLRGLKGSEGLKGERRFALNEIGYEEEGAPDWSRYARPLEVALYNYMLGLGLRRSPRFFLALADRKRS